MSLYLIILLASISVPLAFSFDKKVQYYKIWPKLFLSIFIVAFIYIICDVYMTKNGVWGFNPAYHSGYSIFYLPIEEWLFFILIPYSSIFIHFSLIRSFPKLMIGDKITKLLSWSLILFFVIVLITNYDRTYTVYVMIKLILVLLLALLDKDNVLRSYFISFMVILIPFFIVNGLLTGSFIPDEIVWYNNEENLGIRLFTIPVEDVGYGFSLVLFILLLMNKLDKFNKKIISS